MYHLSYMTDNKGYVLGYILMALTWLSVLGVAAYGVFQTTAGNTRLNAKTITDSLVTQALYALVTESNYSGSLPVPPNPTSNPYSLESLPTDTKAPKKDYWTKDLKYCKNNSPSGLDSIFIAVISSGEDKTFQTTCVNALAGTVNGDDVIKFINGNQMKQGVGGTVYYGDPVEDKATLDALNTNNLKDGELRLVKAEDKVYRYKSGTGWVAISGGGSSSSCPAPGNFQLIGCNIASSGGGCSLYELKGKMAAGIGYNCIVGASKKVYCFGKTVGGSGEGKTSYTTSVPYEIKINANTSLTNVRSVYVTTMNFDAQRMSACAILENGEVWCWGTDGYGGFAAEGSTTNSRVERPYAVRSMRLCDSNGNPTSTYISNAKSMALGSHWGDPYSGTWTFVLTEDKKLYFAGKTINDAGGNPDMNFLGLSTPRNCLTLIPQFDGSQSSKSAVSVKTDLAWTMVVTEDGSVYGGCSNNSSGVCSNRMQFNAIDVATESGSWATCILKTDGTVWCQGNNSSYCAFGIGGSTPPNGLSTSPVKIDANTTLSNVVQITGHNSRFCALTNEGKIYCWGRRTNDSRWSSFGDGISTPEVVCYATLMSPPNRNLSYSDTNKWKIIGDMGGHSWKSSPYLYTTFMMDINGDLYYSGDGVNLDGIWIFGAHTYYPTYKPGWNYCTY